MCGICFGLADSHVFVFFLAPNSAQHLCCGEATGLKKKKKEKRISVNIADILLQALVGYVAQKADFGDGNKAIE